MRFTNTLTGSRPVLAHNAGRHIGHPWMLRVNDVFVEMIALACRRPRQGGWNDSVGWLALKSKPAQPYILDYTLEPWGLKTEAADISKCMAIDGPPRLQPGDPCPHTVYTRPAFFDVVISRLRQMQNQIIAVTDAADMVCLRDPALIVPAFLEYGCDVLHGTEIYPYPPPSTGMAWRELVRRERALEPEATFRYPNGGGFIGRREALIEWMLLVKSLHVEGRVGDNQGSFRLAYTRWHPRVKLDTRCAIFQTMSSCMGDGPVCYQWEPEQAD